MSSSNLKSEKSDVDVSGGRFSESKFSVAPRYTKSSLQRKEPASYRLAEKRIKDIELKRRLNERQYRRKLILRQKRVQAAYEYEDFPTLLGFYFDGFHTQHFYLRREWADILNDVEEEFTRKKELDFRETFKEMQQRYFWPPDCCGTDCGCSFRTRGIYMDVEEVIRDPPQELIDPSEMIQLSKEQKFKPIDLDVDRKNSFYFDEDKGVFFKKSKLLTELNNASVSGGKGGVEKESDLFYYDKKNEMWRLKRTTRILPNDFYFSMRRGWFELKDGKLRQSAFTYSHTYNIWVEKKRVRRTDDALEGLSSQVKSPKDFYFDELLCRWILIPPKKDSKIIYDENGHRFAKKIPLQNPDDFWFDFSEGIFRTKERQKANYYLYNIAHGVWVWPEDKWINSPKKDKMLPRNYFYSDILGKFTLKKGPINMYEFDANNRIYRKKKFLEGKHRPSNWKWDYLANVWKYHGNDKPGRSKNVFKEIVHWRSDRVYEKPWLDYTMGRNWLLQKHPKSSQFNEELIRPNKPAAKALRNIGQQNNKEQWSTKQGSGKMVSQSWMKDYGESDAKISFDQPSEINLTTSMRTTGYGSASGKMKSTTFDQQSETNSTTGMTTRGYGLTSMKSSALAVAGKRALEETGSMSDVFVSGSERNLTSEKGRTKGVQKYEAEPSTMLNMTDSGTLDSSSLFGDRGDGERIDRKRLKISNLGGVLTERDVKAYFFAAVKVRPPELMQEDEANKDYFYIKFKSEHATLAAIKVMQGVDIKGQNIKLEYIKRNQY